MLILGVLALSGCSQRFKGDTQDGRFVASPSVDCESVAEHYRDVVRRAGAVSAYGQVLPGAPWFRVLRGWADWPIDSAEERRQWLQAAATLGEVAWRAELRNADQLELVPAMRRCAQRQVQAPVTDAQWQMLRQRAVVASDYVRWQRLLGAYPLSRWGLRAGVRAWQQEFSSDYGPRPAQRDWEPWHPKLTAGTAQQLLVQAPTLPGLARPSVTELEAWLRDYAPRLRLQIESVDDWPGQPVWQDSLVFDVTQPRMHVQLLPGRDRGTPVWQLVFTVWFSGRAPASALDPYAGALDGIVWRVLLDATGQVRMRDSIHPCGCYHMLFPPQAVRSAEGLDEPPLVPEVVAADGPVELLVRAVDHLIVDVRPVMPDTRGANALPLALYTELLAMPTPAGRTRSLFDATGLVTASARPERWYLWPSGVRSPGAMRIWGRHAIAFVGERHFDDPDLLERLLAEPSH